MGWLCGGRWMQKNASLRSKQVKNFASAKIRFKSLCRFGTAEYKVTVAELTAWKS
jgi:hypothetical protein